ncbi:hypothetical protein F441_08443 [Phytophthora nicotianae CJ01A1]|uniref:Uncharacterized protein n=2 Tax=Phytophthora nicotianae TaxID=4792 RepID=W2X3K4_PHYNI|nr:hypothetical protein F441_08443 [Phytophthora nicotianae CJ01A1]
MTHYMVYEDHSSMILENSATIKCDAKDLHLFLAQKHKDTWMTEDEVKRGVKDAIGLIEVDVASRATTHRTPAK